MNERIRELAEQAGFKTNWQHEDVQAIKMARFEKFAQLIIEQCAEQSMSIGRYNTPSGITPDNTQALWSNRMTDDQNKIISQDYIDGARDAAMDTINVLRKYATAVSGLDEACYTRAQAFDAAADNLLMYYTDVYGVKNERT